MFQVRLSGAFSICANGQILFIGYEYIIRGVDRQKDKAEVLSRSKRKLFLFDGLVAAAVDK